MINIHWLGAGLSSIPGIRRLARKKIPLTVWNRNLEKAKKSIDHVSSSWIQAKEYNLSELESSIKQLLSDLPEFTPQDQIKDKIKKFQQS